jgi:hypothetical protein
MREIQGFSFVPIYLTGALIFLVGGILLIYYNHPIIAGVAIIPGIMLLVLTVLAKIASLKLQEAIKKDPKLRKELKAFYEGKKGSKGKIIEVKFDSKNRNT